MNAPSTPVVAERPWRNLRFEVLEKMETLPSLNSVVLEFLELSQREYFTARDFEAVISKDQALVARVLKLANSGLYGRSRSINSIPEAVVLIGLVNLKKIVFAVSTEGLTRRSLLNYDYDPDRGFWRHSLGVAQTSRVLVDASPECTLRSEEAYVAGLLHDVGQLIIDEFLPPMDGKHVDRRDETAAVGLNHAELGEYILNQWNLPESITACVRHHHDYTQAGDWNLGAAVLGLAEKICAHWGLGRKQDINLSEDVPWEKFREMGEFIGLPEDKWGQVIWDIRQNLVGLDGIFRDYAE
ncbi:MAG: HDOD domain-containing protein [Candidatus Krumholzibacteriota bacterium]